MTESLLLPQTLPSPSQADPSETAPAQASPARQWWHDAVIYQIYPRSFADSDGDGLGDLRGITSRLEHIASLGVDAVWLSPFYPSPQVDAGYDVADYRDVAPEYGTLADFDALVARAHALGLKVVVDLVPNHSSDQHAWFQAALAAGPGSPERARYLFRHSPDAPPNNWGSLFGGSAWQPVQPLTGKDEDRDWWYLHLFAPEQPDFDWTNPDRRREFLRAVHLPDGRLGLFRQQGSAVLTSAVVGHGLIDNPPGQTIRQGDAVRFLSFAELLN